MRVAGGTPSDSQAKVESLAVQVPLRDPRGVDAAGPDRVTCDTARAQKASG